MWPPLAHQEIVGNKSTTLLTSLWAHLIQCAELLSKLLEPNFKYLPGMDLTTDVIFLVVSSANSDLFSYIFATGVGCKIRYVDITGLKNIP